MYNDLTPPAKQVGFGFGHFHFSEHEKLQCPQQAKAHTKKRQSYLSFFCRVENAVLYNIDVLWDEQLVDLKRPICESSVRQRSICTEILWQIEV